MFGANNELQISETDYDSLKESFKDFIKNKTEFTDYNFEGSTITQLVNVLSYNTYINSFYMNMSVNEGFLDTAQLRANVVSNAKKLGYLPYSAVSSRAVLQVIFPLTADSQLIIPAGIRFKATKDEINYDFYTREEFVAIKTNNNFTAIIDAYEGTPVKQSFIYDEAKTSYEILNNDVDLNSLRVTVKDNTNSTNIIEYGKMDDITETSGESRVFFLQENYKERYEFYFGDDVIGKKPKQGSIVEVNYVVTSGDVANGIRNFASIGYVAKGMTGDLSYAPVSTITVSPAAEGSQRETLESIRFNSKHYFNVQNRFVTKNDYTYFLKNKFPYIDSIRVWGGEEHDPPLYGKVVISIKPTNGYILSNNEKDNIRKTVQSRNVLTIEPLFVDPDFLFIKAAIDVRYDYKKTTLGRENVYQKISSAIRNYEQNELTNFGQFFKYSSFTNMVDTIDSSIVSTETVITLEKRFAPVIGSTLSYRVHYNNPLKNPYVGYKGCFSSSGFKINTNNNVLYFDDDGMGKIRIYYGDVDDKIYVNEDAGTINYQTGELKLKAIRFMSFLGNEIQLFAQPANNNIYPVRNQIIFLSYPQLNLFDINTNQLLKSEIIDANGNLIYGGANNIDIPVNV